MLSLLCVQNPMALDSPGASCAIWKCCCLVCPAFIISCGSFFLFWPSLLRVSSHNRTNSGFWESSSWCFMARKRRGFFSPEHIIKSSLVIFHLNQSQVFQLFIKNQVFEIVREALKWTFPGSRINTVIFQILLFKKVGFNHVASIPLTRFPR